MTVGSGFISLKPDLKNEEVLISSYNVTSTFPDCQLNYHHFTSRYFESLYTTITLHSGHGHGITDIFNIKENQYG